MMPQADSPSIVPDLALAERHLWLLGQEEEDVFTFQTFDDDKARKRAGMEAAAARHEEYRDPLARCITGTLEQCADSLIRLNQAGAGVFVTVNRTDGKGRRLANIVGVRALWQEDDGDGKPLPLPPHFEIESSPGKFHRYLLVDGLSVADFRTAEEAIVIRHGSDPNAKDPARVLRLAGFCHLKDRTRPHRVRIVAEEGGQAYGRDRILAAFPPVTDRERPAAPAPAAGSAHRAATVGPDTLRDLRSALLSLRADEYGLWVGMGLALKSLGDPGRGLWLEWSATSEKFDPAAASAKWDTFKPSQTDHRAVFAEAQRCGWVNPAKGARDARPPAGPAPDNLIDVSGENAARVAFEKRIEESSDFDHLVYVLAPEIDRAAIREPTRVRLLKMTAKKAGVSLEALRAGYQGAGGDAGGGSTKRDAPQWLDELNEKHAVVALVGQVRIMNIEDDAVYPGRRLITFSHRPDFVTRYENRETFRNGESMDIGTAWLKHPDRKQYRQIAFMPGIEMPADVFNLWQGYGVEPGMVGRCHRYLEFVREIICGGDEEAYGYVWGWMAHLVQKPAELPGTALVLRGLQGTGKNSFVEPLARIVGAAHYVEMTNMEHLTGKFGAHRAGAMLIFANEASWGGDRQSEGSLKALVTDGETLLEKKHQDPVKVRNFARLIVATNKAWPVAREADDRRFVVLDVSAARKEDGEYFAAIAAEMRGGGYETLMWHLQQADITAWHPRQIPESLRMRGWDIKIKSAGPATEWWFQCLEYGRVVVPENEETALWPLVHSTREVQQAFESWCRRRGQSHHENTLELGALLKDWGIARKRDSGGERPWRYHFPPLKQAREQFALRFAMPVSYWEGDEDTEQVQSA